MNKKLPEGVRNTPKPTYYSYPEEKKLKGMVVKEVGEERKGKVAGDYYMVIQLIKYPDKSVNVRFGYYRKGPGGKKYTWGSQTTFDAPLDFTKRLIEKAKKEGIL